MPAAIHLIIEGTINTMKALWLLPEDTVKVYRNLWLIPAFYFLPYRALKSCDDWVFQIPRNPQHILDDPKALELIESDRFYQTIRYLYRFYTWYFVEAGTNIYVYSGNEPAWLLCSHIEYWIEVLQELNVLPKMEDLLSGDSDMEFGCTPDWKFKVILYNATRYLLLKHPNFKGIVEASKEYRCIEDFNKKNSLAKQNFLDRWYHSRTNHPDVSLESLKEEYENEYGETTFDIEDKTVNIEEDTVSKIQVEDFMNTLSEKDRRILELRMDGVTYEEIAEMLDFKTHSAVIKRIKRIGKAYQQYAGVDLGFQ